MEGLGPPPEENRVEGMGPPSPPTPHGPPCPPMHPANLALHRQLPPATVSHSSEWGMGAMVLLITGVRDACVIIGHRCHHRSRESSSVIAHAHKMHVLVR